MTDYEVKEEMFLLSVKNKIPHSDGTLSDAERDIALTCFHQGFSAVETADRIVYGGF